MRRIIPVIGAAIALVLVASIGAVFLLSSGSSTTIHARFTSATGIYPGNNVDVLGWPVGRVTSVTPHGTYVEVTLKVDGDVRVPENAGAQIVPPSVISDRYVQLSPVYDGGPTIRDGAVIPLSRTQSAVEYADLVRSLDRLVAALGPTAKDPGGVVGRAVHVAAENFGGNGERLRTAISNLADLTGTLTDNGDNLSAIVQNLDRLATALADNDSLVGRFDSDLATASQQLAAEGPNISQALQALNVAIGKVGAFVHDNRAALTADVHGLADVTDSLLVHQRELIETLDVLPLAVDDIGRAVSADHYLRVRSNSRTNPLPSPVLQQLCQQLPLPLCQGSGYGEPPSPLPPPALQTLLGLLGIR